MEIALAFAGGVQGFDGVQYVDTYVGIYIASPVGVSNA